MSASPAKLGIVTGLAFEADILRKAARRSAVEDRVLIAASGPGRKRAFAAGQTLVEQGAGLLMSIGLAGGLDPALSTGDVVLADAVRDAYAKRLPSDPARRQRLFEVVQDEAAVFAGDIAEAVTPAASLGAKRALFREAGSVAVDMESFGVARAAHMAGVPYLALRVISDPADQEIPVSALLAMRADGTVNAWPVALGALRHPGLVPELLRLARQSRRASRVLGRLGDLLFARLGLVLMDL